MEYHAFAFMGWSKVGDGTRFGEIETGMGITHPFPVRTEKLRLAPSKSAEARGRNAK